MRSAVALTVLRKGAGKARIFQRLVSNSQIPERVSEIGKQANDIDEIDKLVKDPENIKRISEEIQSWQEKGIFSVTYGEKDYPCALTALYDPPVILFYKGANLSLINETTFLSVVGSRRADLAGCEIASNIAEEIANRGVCVVSGLARGIDGSAHRGALKAATNFPTVAVLGNGLLSVYPRQHEELAEDILSAGGLLISQFEPDTKPWPYNFLNRNQIIAGMSLGTIVVQATARSGSLVTARYAMEYGKEVMVFPGTISDPRYDGSNDLIKQGAYLITGVIDVEEIFPQIKSVRSLELKGSNRDSLPIGQIAMIEVLKKQGALHADKLAEGMGWPDSFNQDILELELGGILRRTPGNLVELV